LLGSIPALAVLALAPRGVRAFDGGNPIGPVGGAAPCSSGADCGAGEICVNGGCQTLSSVSASQPAAGGELPVAAETPAAGEAPGAAPTVPPGTTPPATTAPGETPAAGGVGGLISAEQPLAARIYAGTCGNLGADAAYQLIDIGPLGAGAASGQQAPVGSPLAIPARFSTTVVNAKLADLVASDFAVDIRLDAADPATSIACGSVGGVIGGQISAEELAIGLRERNQSGNAGVAWFREQNDRTVVDVFVAQGLQEGAATGGILAPPAQTSTQAQPAETATATPEATAAAEATAAPNATPEPTGAVPTVPPEEAAMTPTVTVIQAPSPTPGAAPSGTEAAAQAATPTALNVQAGDRLVTTTDVNLRAAPNTDAAVVTILAAGSQVEVTGPPQGEWIPVRDVSTGRRGFVSSEFVQRVTA
jgi:hypothetical protein